MTTPRPELAPAAGAALIAARGPAAPATAMAPAARVAAGVAAAGAAADSPATETFRALAWSDDVAAEEPLPYSGETDDDDPGTADLCDRSWSSSATPTPPPPKRRHSRGTGVHITDIHRTDILTTAVIVGITDDNTSADGRSGTKHDPGAGGHSAADDDAGAGCH